MPVPVKVRTPRPPTLDVLPVVDTRRHVEPPVSTAMERGPADVVRARSLVGNAAVNASMSGVPRGAEPAPSPGAHHDLVNPAGWAASSFTAERAGGRPCRWSDEAPDQVT